jgi:hypothetical protein
MMHDAVASSPQQVRRRLKGQIKSTRQRSGPASTSGGPRMVQMTLFGTIAQVEDSEFWGDALTPF